MPCHVYTSTTNPRPPLPVRHFCRAQALVSAAAEHRSNSKVQAGVAGALRNLSVNDEIAEEIASAGGIDALIAASQEHSLWRAPRQKPAPAPAPEPQRLLLALAS